MRIVVGISDGTVTEVVRGKLQEGQAVVTGENAAARQPQSRWRLGF